MMNKWILPLLLLILSTNSIAQTDLERDCDKGDAHACGELGLKYFEGQGVHKNTRKALEFFVKSCGLGNAYGCGLSGFAYETGMGTQQDQSTALKYYKKSCDMKNPKGCESYQRLSGGDSLGNSNFKKACHEGRGEACSVMGMAYEEGDGVPQNTLKALEFYQKGCTYRDSASCAKAGLLYESGKGVKKNTVQAIDFYTKACKYGDMNMCNYVGAKYYRADGIKQNIAMAIDFFQTACNGGHADGCQNVIKLYQAYCDGGHAFSCNALGAMYFKGQGVNKNPSKAAELVVKSCNLGDASGCYLSGMVYEQGIGVTQNLNTALQYYQKSCQMQDNKACRAAQKLQPNTQKHRQPERENHSQTPVVKPEQTTKPATLASDRQQQNEVEALYSKALKLANSTEGCNPEAYKLFKQAAQKGHIEASNTLAYYATIGVCEAKSYSRMIHWYENAANHGDTNSMFTLGKIYEEGDYDQRADKDKALYWFEKCAKQGKQGCQNAYNRLKK